MGNSFGRDSYRKDALIRHLRNALGANPVLPVDPNLKPLCVLVKDSHGYRHVGSVASLCKAGEDRNFLQDVENPSKLQKWIPLRKSYFQENSIGEQSSQTFSDDRGVFAKLLVGQSSAAAWFERASSIKVHIPECWVREFRIEGWKEMMQHFNPDMTNDSIPGKPSWNGKRHLIIVQKVVLVSHITITGKSKTHSGLNVKTSSEWGEGLQALFSVGGSDTFEFTLSATKSNRKLPIAFYGYRYTYDKSGVKRSTASQVGSKLLRRASSCARGR